MNHKNLIGLLLLTVLVSACAKKSSDEASTRPEFGGRTATNFYNLFQAAPSGCGTTEPVIAHQQLKFDNQLYFETSDGTEVSAEIFFVGSRFRLNIDFDFYYMGGRNTVIKSKKTDHESVIGDWSIQNKTMVLRSNDKFVAVAGDGLPREGHETLAISFGPELQKLVPRNISTMINKTLLLIPYGGSTLNAQDGATMCNVGNISGLVFR